MKKTEAKDTNKEDKDITENRIEDASKKTESVDDKEDEIEIESVDGVDLETNNFEHVEEPDDMEIIDVSKVEATCDEDSKRKSTKEVIFIVLGTVLLLALFIAGFLFLLNNSAKNNNKEATEEVQEMLNSTEETISENKVIREKTNIIDDSKLKVVDISTEKYTYDMMVDDINELCSRYGDIIHSEVIGQSVCNKDIYVVTLGNLNAKNHIFAQSTIHAREYMNTQLVMKMLEYYGEYCDIGRINKKSYRDLFENTCIHVVPMSNPDGVTISQFGVKALHNSELTKLVHDAYLKDKELMSYYEGDGDFKMFVDNYQNPSYKRTKGEREITFEEYQEMWKANGRGVDLNNNFDADWENIALKEYPCYGSFKGETPASEPETKAISEYAKKYDFKYYLSYHSRGDIIYYDCQGNTEEMSEMELEFSNIVADIIGYRTESTIGAFNVNLGGFSDWVQLKLNKRSVTIESGQMPCPLPISEFRTMWLRHKLLWGKLAEFEF